MKKFKASFKSLIALTMLLAATTCYANDVLQRQMSIVKDTTIWGLPVNDILLKRNGDLMSVGLDMGLGAYVLKGDKVTVFTPMLINGKDSLDLNSVGLYSRIRYIQYMREKDSPLGGGSEVSLQYSKRPETMDIMEAVPYQEWMNGAILYMRRRDYGCCNTLIDQDLVPLGRWSEMVYTPEFKFVTPEAEKMKIRELKGRAYIDFPVNMTNLYPDYRKNPIELQKIIATIDSVKNSEDVTIKEITIKGYASPESPWSNNTRLAIGRTKTLKEYVQNLYRFDENLIKTDYWPEDWDGLREFVEGSGLEHKNEILALIDDTSIEPDPKEALLKKRYPAEYDFLLKTVYPGLRHSDYTIQYTIRQYNDPAEIREVIKTAPQNLSLEEMFVLAKTLEPGSDEYNDVFETAVRMYPNDEIANLNAASAAMQRGDLDKAAKYLEKAGDTTEAQYARAIYAIQIGDYDKAKALLAEISGEMTEARETLSTLNQILNLENN